MVKSVAQSHNVSPSKSAVECKIFRAFQQGRSLAKGQIKTKEEVHNNYHK